MRRQWLRVAALMMLAAVVSGCAVVIEDGQAGVKADFGKIADEALGTGWHWYLPVVTWIETWNIKTQEIKEQANVPSSEGLISQLDVSVIYNIQKDSVVKVRKTIGVGYQHTVIDPYIREAIRNIVSGYPVKALFSDEGRTAIGENILQFLRTKLEPRGITVQDVLLRDVRLPPSFAQSIETKLRAEQEALQKEFELLKAKKDAEIEVARAQGVAKSNEIIASSLSENYLRYRWLEGLQKSQATVIYVPTEANLPLLEAGRWGDIEKSLKSLKPPAAPGSRD